MEYAIDTRHKNPWEWADMQLVRNVAKYAKYSLLGMAITSAHAVIISLEANHAI